MANIQVSSEINSLLTATTLNQSTAALGVLGAGYPVLFLNGSAPVNGKFGFTNTSVLKPNGVNIVAVPFLSYSAELDSWYNTNEDFATAQSNGWLLTSPAFNYWQLDYTVADQPIGKWNGLGGGGTNPASSAIVWTADPEFASLGTPLFTYGETPNKTVGKIGQILHSTIGTNVLRYECISESPYTWQLNQTVNISPATPTTPVIGSQWFDERSNQSILYTGSYWVGTDYSLQIKKEQYTRKLAAHMVEQVDSRLIGKNAANALALFTGLGSNQFATTFTQNASCWLHDLRPQLCGFHMGAGDYGQSYGLMPLGGRFFLNVNHGGPAGNTNSTVYYPLPNGSTFTTTMSRRFSDAPTDTSSPNKTPDNNRIKYDFSIYIMADAAPSTLPIIPIVKLDIIQELMHALAPPLVVISQGGAGSAFTLPKQPTPQNRKCAVKPFDSSSYYRVVGSNSGFPENNLREPFGHYATYGDSGCPVYLLVNNKLYLHNINTNLTNPLGYYLDYLQDLVNRAAAEQGIPPILVQSITNPPLP
jgi:hypothetical protein